MIHRKRSIISVAVLALALVLSMSASVFAESNTYDSQATFNGGSKIDSNFSSAEIAKKIEDLQPGDDVTFNVTYTNNYDESTDWYMENTVVQTLEKTTQAKKVSGTGDAENGGYTYELVNIDSTGKKHVLFSNAEVGGEAEPDGMQGLEQATNATDDWFYIDTLAKGESGKVILKVAFEGETEVNDYMDTDGELNVRFAVELTPQGDNPPGKRVKTGDQSDLLMWASIALVAALLLFVLAFLSNRRDRRKGGDA